MHIVTTRQLRFHHAKTRSVHVTVPPGTVAEVPDWVRQSDMFRLAAKDGSARAIVGERSARRVDAVEEDQGSGPKTVPAAASKRNRKDAAAAPDPDDPPEPPAG